VLALPLAASPLNTDGFRLTRGRWKLKRFQVTLDFERPVEGQKQLVLTDQRSECA
jgi:hypothetical protein